MSERPFRFYFLDDDPAALWLQGQTGDDLGPEYPGATIHLLRLDHFDDSLVSIEDPYGRGLIARIEDDKPEEEEDIPFEFTPEVDPADRCARCSHVAAQHMPDGGSCGACGCMKFVAADTGGEA